MSSFRNEEIQKKEDESGDRLDFRKEKCLLFYVRRSDPAAGLIKSQKRSKKPFRDEIAEATNRRGLQSKSK